MPPAIQKRRGTFSDTLAESSANAIASAGASQIPIRVG